MKKILVIVFLCCLLLSSCQRTEEAAPELKDPVSANIDTEEVKRGDIVNVINYDGALVPASVELYFETDGVIDVISAYSGKYVNEGDVLIRLESGQVDKEIKSLEDEIENATIENDFEEQLQKINLEMLNTDLQSLQAAGASSQAIRLKQLDIESANLSYEEAKAEREERISDLNERLQKLKDERDKRTLIAPISGYLYMMEYAEEGSYVRAERAICYIIDENTMTLVVEDYIGRSVAERYHIYAWIEGEAWELQYQPVSDEDIRAAALSGKTLKTTFLIDDKKDPSVLKAGMYCAVVLEQVAAEDTLYVPVDAVKAERGGAYVYVVTDNGGRERRTVKRGQSNGIDTEILEGLEEGEVVYVQN